MREENKMKKLTEIATPNETISKAKAKLLVDKKEELLKRVSDTFASRAAAARNKGKS